MMREMASLGGYVAKFICGKFFPLVQYFTTPSPSKGIIIPRYDMDLAYSKGGGPVRRRLVLASPLVMPVPFRRGIPPLNVKVDKYDNALSKMIPNGNRSDLTPPPNLQKYRVEYPLAHLPSGHG